MVNPSMERISLDMELPEEAHTMGLGQALGAVLRPGAVLLLTGELGAGKTVMARGLARGLGVDDDYHIVSPTFTLLNIYPGRITFYHADLYRLSAGEAMDLELLDQAAGGVLAVEWAERGDGCWPAGAIWIQLKVGPGESRTARISAEPELLDRLKQRIDQGE